VPGGSLTKSFKTRRLGVRGESNVPVARWEGSGQLNTCQPVDSVCSAIFKARIRFLADASATSWRGRDSEQWLCSICSCCENFVFSVFLLPPKRFSRSRELGS